MPHNVRAQVQLDEQEDLAAVKHFGVCRTAPVSTCGGRWGVGDTPAVQTRTFVEGRLSAGGGQVPDRMDHHKYAQEHGRAGDGSFLPGRRRQGSDGDQHCTHAAHESQ